MKRFLILIGATMLLAAAATPIALAGENEPPEHVIICHVAGLADDPANYITLDLPWVAVYGEAGHFFENGTPRAGHEQDTLGACNPPPPPTDVCPNLEGNQATLPEGYHFAEDENGRTICVPDEPPPPREVATANAVCDIAGEIYNVTGSFDGNPAPVFPTTIPGGTNGTTLVAVQAGEDIQLILVNTDGTCLKPPPPPGVGNPNGAASVICDLGARLYRLAGTVDGQTADTVNPSTIPGSTKGVTNVTVTRGDTSVRTTVTTNGDCGPLPTPPTVTGTPVTPAAVVVAPVTKPAAPAAKPKPKPVRKPVTKKKIVKKKTPTVHICKPVNGHKRVWVKSGPNKGCQTVGKPEPSHLTG